MIIAIDGYEANVSRRVGIGTYAYEIIRHIYELAVREAESGTLRDSYRIYLPQAPLPDMPESRSWWQYRVTGPRRLWTFIGLPLALLGDKPAANVVFSPTHYIPRFTGIPRVASVMDLSYLAFPDMFARRDLHKLVNWTRYSAGHASALLTISRFSKDAIIKAYNVPEKHVTVTYPGIGKQALSDLMTKAEITRKYRISKNYILSVGTLQPRKNYVKLIAAFSLFLAKNRQKFGRVQLVIVGKKGWLFDEILEAPAKYGVSDDVVFLNFVSDTDLAALYKSALCFVMPSLYEGFGLPALEAMSYGTPVVVSNVSSLPEVVGKAGVYVDPQRTESIAEGLLAAVRQRNLMQGRYRVKRGHEQVKKFTWENAARETLEVLKKVART
jgi:glycosyltransferase involved in cell wall biosynthesis